MALFLHEFVQEEWTMKKLQILGSGCPNCQKLAAQTEAAAKAMGLEYELEKVTDMDAIMASGVMTIPALAVDGQVMVVGRIPSISDLQKLLA
jgi:small redox-active disulfide protein 2